MGHYSTGLFTETIFLSFLSDTKYGSGFPFYRFEKLQASLGIPLAASTQWEIVEDVATRSAQ